jgi:glutamyl-Q tRNA(Asp) synthetase
MNYRGRFAPSPSGLLHFGSLIAALASFLDAKKNQGKWLVRIEDIDPPREQKGAATAILKTLESFGLHWDEPVLYQSNQTDYYLDFLQQLTNNNLTYLCACTRANIKAMGGIYNQHCKNLSFTQNNQQPLAIRLNNTGKIDHFTDLILGAFKGNNAIATEDFILKRKDGLFAYQLAVVLDDIFQNISHVIRGADLLEPTLRQLNFFATLGKKAPLYGHVPLAITAQGYKLSKQNRAPALNNSAPQQALFNALRFLGQQPDAELITASVDEIIAWAIAQWRRELIPQQQQISIV